MDRNRPDTPVDEKLQGDEIRLSEKSKLLAWLDNFWYHYKWHVIIALFFVLVIFVCIRQQAGDRQSDINVTYSGSYCFTAAEAEQMHRTFSNVTAKDYNGDGVKYAGFVRYQIYSAEEIKKENDAQTEALDQELGNDEGRPIVGSAVNTAYNTEQFRQFNQFVMTGESYIYVCSPYIYDELKSRGNVRLLKDILGEQPKNSYDESAVLLKDTAIYASSEILQKLPDDTVVCLLGKSLFSTDDVYNRSVETFLNLIK